MDRQELENEADRLMKTRDGLMKAVEIYMDLLKNYPEDIYLMDKVHMAIYLSGDWGDSLDEGYEKEIFAIRLLEKAVQLEPNNPDTHLHLASGLNLWSSNREAYIRRSASEYMHTIELDPHNVWGAIGVARKRRYLNLTLDQAVSYLEKARSDKPGQQYLMMELGRLYQEKGDYEKALRGYETLLTKIPENEDDPMRKEIKGITRTILRLRGKIEKG